MFCELMYAKKNDQKGANKFLDCSISCGIFIPMDDKHIERTSQPKSSSKQCDIQTYKQCAILPSNKFKSIFM
jgi:hypothetical protein